MKRGALAAIGGLFLIASGYFHERSPTTLSLRIGQTFEDVARHSSFPVMASSTLDPDNDGDGVTWVTEPAVIIHFSDPQYEFTLPPTTFAAIDYIDHKVLSIATSPMLKKLPFDKAFDIAVSLQRQFQAKGWQPENRTTWLSLNDKEKLRQDLRRDDPTYRNYVELVAPKKYSIIFRFYCAERCDSRFGLDRYLIDIGVGEDYGYAFGQGRQATAKSTW